MRRRGSGRGQQCATANGAVVIAGFSLPGREVGARLWVRGRMERGRECESIVVSRVRGSIGGWDAIICAG